MSYRTSQLLLCLHITLTRDHNALSLWRASTMQALRAVAYGSGTEREVLDQTQDAHTIYRVRTLSTCEVLTYERPDLLMLQVSLARHRNHQTACYVLSETCALVRIAGYILLTYVGQEHIDQVVARLRLLSLSRASDLSLIHI